MKNIDWNDFCVNECPVFHNPWACISGEECPIKILKKERLQKKMTVVGICLGRILGDTQFMFGLMVFFAK